MTQIYSMIIDVVAVFILLFTVYRAYKLGFLRSIVLLVGYIASIIVAFYLSSFLSSLIYDNLIRKQIIDSIDSTLSGITEISNISIAIPAILASLPSFVSNAVVSSFGGNEAIVNMIQEKTQGIVENVSTVIADFIVQPLVCAIMQTALCLIIFILCVIIVKTIAKIFKGFYVIPILGTINSLLGGVLGIVQSGIFLLLLGLISNTVIIVTTNSLSWFNDSILKSTYIFKYFYSVF